VEIIVKSKGCDVPTRLRSEAVERIEHATRFFDRLLGVEMVFSAEHNPRIPTPALVELTARTKGHHIRAEGAGEDHRSAVDVAVVRFERQLARYKARLVDRQRGRGRPVVVPSVSNGEREEPPVADDLWPTSRIVRRKRFEYYPMMPEQAAIQLELLDHDFYVFTNRQTGQCSVIYRRRDGDLGLIEPED
jgi:putative sigma-54 modulation protein